MLTFSSNRGETVKGQISPPPPHNGQAHTRRNECAYWIREIMVTQWKDGHCGMLSPIREWLFNMPNGGNGYVVSDMQKTLTPSSWVLNKNSNHPQAHKNPSVSEWKNLNLLGGDLYMHDIFSHAFISMLIYIP